MRHFTLITMFLLIAFAAGCLTQPPPRYEINAVTCNLFEPGSQSQAVCGSTGVNATLPGKAADPTIVLDEKGNVAKITPGTNGETITASGSQNIQVGNDMGMTKEIDTAAALTTMQKLKNTTAGTTPSQGVEGEAAGDTSTEGTVDDADSASVSVPAVP
jgi:hypothetical protein